jgi:pyridoxal biosynthesis lyase PdxS
MADNGQSTGTFRVKSGMAQMLKGGVIMDVVDAEQARIAEEAGAVAVMALERVPADIRADGGVARMSDPEKIVEIQESVTIPVMAKARIGHFVEAQILEALEVDYIDESEVLTPADEKHHIDKAVFEVPFVCGATNLGEALRRIGEGAAMIRSKGEAGTGNVVEAVRHMRAIIGGIRRLGALEHEEMMTEALRARALGRRERAAPRRIVHGRRHSHPCGCGHDDAARGRWRIRGERHLQERGPGPQGAGHSGRDDPLQGREGRGRGEQGTRRGDGRQGDG